MVKLCALGIPAGGFANPAEVFSFLNQFTAAHPSVPVVAVPSAYNEVYDHELQARGVKLIIYANHMLRSSYKAMEQTARAILTTC